MQITQGTITSPIHKINKKKLKKIEFLKLYINFINIYFYILYKGWIIPRRKGFEKENKAYADNKGKGKGFEKGQ